MTGQQEQQRPRAEAGARHGDHRGDHHGDRHLLRDAGDRDDWEWRRRIRANPTTKRVYQGLVFLLGLLLVGGGLLLVPLPGPGWFIVFFGVAVWASEFEPAARLLEFGKARLREWQAWLSRQPLWVKGVVGLATAVFVLAVVWVVLRVGGIPGPVPDGVADWLRLNAGL